MKAYVFQAALLCEACAHAQQDATRHTPMDGMKDSNYWPQGPYENGGGEADCPQHCDSCNVFLGNPLTSDGVAYVRNALIDHASNEDSKSDATVLATWSDFYDIKLADSDDLDSFFGAYVACAYFTSTDDEGEPFDRTDPNMSGDCQATLKRDCIEFLADRAIRNAIEGATHARESESGYEGNYAQAGHDFWLTRNGHGAGFWDGDWSEPQANILTEASKAAGSRDLLVGNDGDVHAS